MSIAKVQHLNTFISAANTGVIVAMIKNGNQYFIEVPVAGLAIMRSRVEAKGSLSLKHWTPASPSRLPNKAKASPSAKISAHRIHIEFKAKVDALAAAGDKAAIEALAKRQYGRSKGAYRAIDARTSAHQELGTLKARAELAQSEYEYAFAALKTIKVAA